MTWREIYGRLFGAEGDKPIAFDGSLKVGGKLLSHWQKRLVSRDAIERLNAAADLEQLRSLSKPALPLLIYATSDKDEKVREYAVRAIGNLGEDAIPALNSLLDKCRDNVASVRSWTAVALGEIGPSAAPAVFMLQKLLDDGNADVRRNAAVALGRIGPAAATAAPRVAELLMNSSDVEGDSSRYAQALAHFGTTSIDSLITGLAHPELKIRSSCASSLGTLGRSAEPAVDRLIEALSDKPPVCIFAARSLGQIRSDAEHVVPALVSTMNVDHFEFRRQIIESLGEFGQGAKSAVETLLPFLNDEKFVSFTANALGKIGPSASPQTSIPFQFLSTGA